jgi:serine/threonine-protein kinase PknK
VYQSTCRRFTWWYTSWHMPLPPTALRTRYELRETLGRGGAGTVYRALDRLRGEEVALKLLEVADPLALAALRTEFRILRRLNHPRLVRVYDFGCAPGADAPLAYYTERIVDGQPIDQCDRQSSWALLRTALGDGLRALGRLHGAGLRHGDFTPKNLLVDRAGRGTLIDLGCSAAPPPGLVSGTPGYIAPELVGEQPWDPRADLYSVGATLKRLGGLFPCVPEQVMRLAERLTQRARADRPADVAEVLSELGEPADPVSVVPAEARELLGRGDVLAAWQSILDAVEHGRAGPRVLLVQGPVGSGRTRLLDECKGLAELVVPVLHGEPRGPGSVHALLRCALGDASLPNDLTAAWQAQQAFGTRSDPLALVLDDVEQLEAADRALLVTLIASLGCADRIAVLLAGSELELPRLDTVERIHLQPLGRDELRAWVGPHASDRFVDELVRVSGGLPGRVATLLGRVRLGNEDLGELAREQLGPGGAIGASPRLDQAARRTLALTIAMDGRVSLETLRSVVGDERGIGSLVELGWLTLEGDELCVANPCDFGAVADWVGAAAASALHRRVADHLEQRFPHLVAERARHLALAGAHQDALGLLVKHRTQLLAEVPAARRAAETIVSQQSGLRARLLAAELCELAGDPRRALDHLDACAGTHLDATELFERELRAGSCLLRLGDATRSLPQLERLVELAADGAQRAAAIDLVCRAHIQRGEHARALELAQQAMSWTDDPATLSALDEDVGVAASYLGLDELARRHFDRADRHGVNASPQTSIRRLSHRAIHEFRTGHYGAAEQRYREALSLAEQHSLPDQAASCALNLGALQHRCGRWGEALRSYERGQALAAAMVKVRTSVALGYNLAQLFCDLGGFDRAEALLAATRTEAEAAGLASFVALCPMLAGEIQLRRGALAAARLELDLARATLTDANARRELVDAELHATEVELAAGDHRAAAARLAVAHQLLDATGAEDLRTRAMLLDARTYLCGGRTGEAVALLERALSRAEQSSEAPLLAELEGWLAAALERRGAHFAARQQRERALARWDRCVAELPIGWHDRFWSHPLRAGLRDVVQPTGLSVADGESDRVRQLERLLAIYRRLSSSLDARDVLAYAMDAAIELTGAERGFVLVRRRAGRAVRASREAAAGAGAAAASAESERLEVAVARNIDRESIGRSAMKFSHSIARQVIETATPLLAAEAQADERFAGERSVLALGLVSVLCVPIPGPSGVLGALYVDNRFQRGRFEDAQRELLSAFADQVGIALTNARLHHDLSRRTRELQEERHRMSALLAEREREVDRLSEQMRSTHRALGDRLEYAGMVGRSGAMQRVFEVVERVAPSNITVLVEGESGTGKELVARAIHQIGASQRGPFVSVNCAAMPETLLESELFGYVRGAFTGADRDRKGLFVHAGEGTLFLDEVGELPLTMQAKLLRVLEEREVRPLGTPHAVPVRARVVCATNRHLRAEVDAGRFREDLFYRLAVVEIRVPPLRERLEDLPLLAEHLLGRLAREQGRPPRTLSGEALRRLLGYGWPGNARELENVLSQALLFATDAEIRAGDIVLPTGADAAGPARREQFAQHEALQIAAALRAARWNVAEVCRSLAIPRTSLYRKLRRYGLTRPLGEGPA